LGAVDNPDECLITIEITDEEKVRRLRRQKQQQQAVAWLMAA
jgi:hypothetical protein